MRRLCQNTERMARPLCCPACIVTLPACLVACWLTGSSMLDCLCHSHVWLVLTGQMQHLVALKQDLRDTVDLRVIPDVSCWQWLQTVAVQVYNCQQSSQGGFKG